MVRKCGGGLNIFSFIALTSGRRAGEGPQNVVSGSCNAPGNRSLIKDVSGKYSMTVNWLGICSDVCNSLRIL